jgi:Uma2 family endonuclease
MTVMVRIEGSVPAGPLTVADMPLIDMEASFEVSDGKLEILTPPTPWHQITTRAVENLLDRQYATTLSDVPLAVGDNGRRPDVLALDLTRDEILDKRLSVTLPDMVRVAVEVISHDDDPRRDAIAVRRDRETKFAEYAGVGIPEYWIVDEIADDPRDAQVEIFHLTAGRYALELTAKLSDLLSGAVRPPVH